MASTQLQALSLPYNLQHANPTAEDPQQAPDVAANDASQPNGQEEGQDDGQPTLANARALQAELAWLHEVIQTRMQLFFGQECPYEEVHEVLPPVHMEEGTFITAFLEHYEFSFAERLVLALALAPHVQPEIADLFFIKNARYDRPFTEFGGVASTQHQGFLPTGETALFVLAGRNLEARFSLLPIFGADHVFASHNILAIDPPPAGEPAMSGSLSISREYLELFTTGQARKPNFSREFPASLVSTELDWNDLVVDSATQGLINEISAWVTHGQTLAKEWGLGKKIRPGYRALFHGPPGTGKTMTAALLGKRTGRDVYRIDLSMVVSKYIGETEKNLSNIFAQAEHKHWILFFDEADAIFGKRTKVEDAHDRFANQEVSYLLQRLETFDGIVILASNLRANIDDAFNRRFETVIEFAIPGHEERYKIWQQGMPEGVPLDDDANLWQLAREYKISGGTIMNVIRYASLMALQQGVHRLTKADLLEGVRREMRKEGRTTR